MTGYKMLGDFFLVGISAGKQFVSKDYHMQDQRGISKRYFFKWKKVFNKRFKWSESFDKKIIVF